MGRETDGAEISRSFASGMTSCDIIERNDSREGNAESRIVREDVTLPVELKIPTRYMRLARV